MKEKLKNRGLWVALFALLGMVLMDTIPHFNLGRYQEYVDVILFILAAAGVISNPSAGKWFADNQKEGENK
ncbi:hypothetical protein P4159_26780 [Bacillus thuringiensis]|uniref:hypothetical protein n=1 Tax=Bacillus cereus group TaxID=86661 RepID=UPI0007C1B6BD|nr:MULTISPECIES: hypothetical protein [Bacillus cereus group]AND06655.1 hypothetical protein Bt4C1_05505 [Bacillus thuringiensis serovar alesti]MEC3597740.1 hypothetical protein [Bacillus thuringiensis]MED1833368.1 hypothetical protein [Bacillus thuringiensis]MED2671275.1 hypothetical protein [Bacillus thuringiensis]MED2716659.1 hypothetical protein [Bacillus thuringiensis]